jgi:hypothetical protein
VARLETGLQSPHSPRNKALLEITLQWQSVSFLGHIPSNTYFKIQVTCGTTVHTCSIMLSMEKINRSTRSTVSEWSPCQDLRFWRKWGWICRSCGCDAKENRTYIPIFRWKVLSPSSRAEVAIIRECGDLYCTRSEKGNIEGNGQSRTQSTLAHTPRFLSSVPT